MCVLFFFVKQKTAYEMRISDWSSDVCSSDLVFYGLSTFEGSFMAIRPVNALSHYTDWTVGHVHAGALGWVAMITFGSLYALTPWMWKQERMYSPKLVEVHFWLALSGTVVYVFAMWTSGIIQGLMCRPYNETGTLTY